MIYLDNSATTKQAEEVTRKMLSLMEEEYGNPSSLHDMGMKAELFVKEARKEVASMLSCSPEEIYFNSGGTEGNNHVLFNVPHAMRHSRKKVAVSKVEHPAVLECCKVLEQRGFALTYIPCDETGMVSVDDIRNSVDEETALVSLMCVNNETGAIMPVREAAEIAHESGALFHTDIVQAYGKLDLSDVNADLMTVSAHKIHGPKGVGALFVRKGLNLQPFIFGGGQERNMRSGTENVPGVSGLGEASKLASSDMEAGEYEEVRSMRDALWQGIEDSIGDVIFNSRKDGLPHILNVSFLGTRGEVLLHTLEEEGIFVSTGSACSSNKKSESHVLKAMGRSSKEIEGALRFSFGRYNKPDEVDFVLEKLKESVERFRRLGSFR